MIDFTSLLHCSKKIFLIVPIAYIRSRCLHLLFQSLENLFWNLFPTYLPLFPTTLMPTTPAHFSPKIPEAFLPPLSLLITVKCTPSPTNCIVHHLWLDQYSERKKIPQKGSSWWFPLLPFLTIVARRPQMWYLYEWGHDEVRKNRKVILRGESLKKGTSNDFERLVF